VGPREIVLKGLGALLNPNPLLAAATVSGSNKVQFVLDVGFLARAVTLGPRLAGAAAGEPDSAPRARRQTRPRVLLVDDSRSIREAVSHILRSGGYAVDTAADGREAWEKLQLRAYDVLLTDLEMPRLHGLDLIARCRDSAPLGGLPIVVLTSKTSDENRAAAHQRGADAFLTKPVSRRHLLREVGQRLRS
jgi:CheY-like chemotaxis protein